MKNLLFLLIVTSSTVYAGKAKFNYEIKNSQQENINSFVRDDSVGRDVEELEIAAGLKKGIKLGKKLRLNLKTDLNIKLHNVGDAYDKVELRNDDNINTTLKKASIKQKVSLAKKFSKKLIVTAGAEVEAGRGYTVAQDFITPSPTGYFVIDDPYNKYSLNLSGSYKLTKKIKFRGIYEFSEFNHEKNYTFLKDIGSTDQGDNDRRIHSLGALFSYKNSKNFDAALSAQVNQTNYRERLALEEAGTFTLTGLGIASRIKDTRTTLNLNFFQKIFSLKLVHSLRDDEINGGDTHAAIELEAKLKLKFLKNFVFESSYAQKETGFKNQIAFTSFTAPADPNAAKREDTQKTLKASLTASLGKKAPSLKLFAEQTEIDSNNVFGEYSNRTIGLAISGKF